MRLPVTGPLCSPILTARSPVSGPKVTSKRLVKVSMVVMHSNAKREITTAWFFMGSGQPATATVKKYNDERPR